MNKFILVLFLTLNCFAQVTPVQPTRSPEWALNPEGTAWLQKFIAYTVDANGAAIPISGSGGGSAFDGQLKQNGNALSLTNRLPVELTNVPLATNASNLTEQQNQTSILNQIKLKTDNLDVLLSTRTKPGDVQTINFASTPTINTLEDTYKTLGQLVITAPSEFIQLDLQGYNSLIIETISGSGFFNVQERADITGNFNSSLVYQYDSLGGALPIATNYTIQNNFKYFVKPSARYVSITSQTGLPAVLKFIGVKGDISTDHAKLNLLQTISSNSNILPETILTDKNTVFSNGTGSGSAQKSKLVAGMFKSILPTLQDGDQSELLLNNKGDLKVVVSETVPTLVLNSGFDVNNFPALQLVSGTVNIGTMPAAPLPFNSATLSEQQTQTVNLAAITAQNTTLNNLVNLINTKTMPAGQNTMANSSPVVISSNQTVLPVNSLQLPTTIGSQLPANSLSVLKSDDVFFTNVLNTPGVNTNFITGTVTTTGWTDVKNFKSVSFSAIGTLANGTFTVEQTNNVASISAPNVPFQNSSFTNLSNSLGTASVSTSEVVYNFSLQARYFRIRFLTASTGNVTVSVNLKQAELLTNNMFVSGSVTSNVNGTVTANSSATILSSDIGATVITTSATTGAISPSTGSTYQVSIPVIAVSGTNPTLDTSIEESDDSGANWYKVYDFPRITSVGSYRSPVLINAGNRIRYVQIIGGTTPSFNRSIQRSQHNLPIDTSITQLFDRTINPNLNGSTTQFLRVANAKNIQLNINFTVLGMAPNISLQGSDDNGQTWYLIGAGFAPAGLNFSQNFNNINSQLVRIIVNMSGTGNTINYVLIKGY